MALASDAVDIARRTLQDYDADRYSAAVLLALLNGARRSLLVAKPDVYTIEGNLTLVAGAKQTLPADCAFFYDMPRNSAGGAVTIAEREFLDAFMPNWRTGQTGPTQHFCYDEREPRSVDVYPPAVEAAVNRVVYAQQVSDLASSDPLAPREAMHLEAMADYVVGRALLEDAESPTNAQRAMLHLNLVGTAWNIDVSSLLRGSPNTANVGGRIPKSTTGV